MKGNRLLCLVLAVCTLISVLGGLSFTVVSAASTEISRISSSFELVQTGKDYGLLKNIQGSAVLHCFDWKYNDIKSELKSIAEAGFTAVQTSPAQPANSGEWWWLYQPKGFYVGSNALGTKEELKALCTEAEKYGVKVVVDIVANHLAGDHSNIQDDLKDGQYWHQEGGGINYGNRWEIHQRSIGMPDINSEHSYVQQKVADYVRELAAIGVDGIRWDAAKHIAVPSENGCSFWPTVSSAADGMWHYGEILDDPVADNDSLANSLMKEYTSYISATDSGYCGDVRMSFRNNSVPSSDGKYAKRGISSDKLVYWAESHDTYSNDNSDGKYDSSQFIDQNKIDRAYAVIASRSGASALYFSRPYQTSKNSIRAGEKGSTHFTAPEVAAVNKLKNACINEKDAYGTGDNCAVVCRESGATVVLGSGSNKTVTVPNVGSTTKAGTYTDLVSGSVWTVTSSTISGQVGQSGIAVLLNAKPAGPSALVSPASKTYTTDTLELTLSFENATSGQYSVNGGAFQSFTNGQKLTVGKGTAAGTQATIKVKASNGSETSEPETYEYSHVQLAATGIYCNSAGTGWSSVNCYIYKDGQSYGEWPGEAMQSVGDNLWYFGVPTGFESCSVIFSQNGSNQYPVNDGLNYAGGAMIYSDGQWQQYTVVPATTAATTAAATVPETTHSVAPVTTAAPTDIPAETTQVQATEPTEDDVVIVPPVILPSSTVYNTTVTENEKYRYGDVNTDEKVNVKDATILQKAIAKIIKLNELQLVLGNVNSDGKVNVKDVTMIQKRCANIIDSFDTGKWYTVPSKETRPTQPVPTKPYEPIVTEPTEAPVFTQAPVKTDPVEPETTSLAKVTTAATEPTPTQTSAPTQPATTIPNEPDEYIYLKANWSSANCHSWSSGGEGTAWPGTAMVALGNGVFRIKLPDGHNNVVFNGDGQQTGDITVEGTGKIWDNGWSNYSNSGSVGGSTASGDNIQVSQDCVYFKDTAGWGAAYCHSWSPNGESTSWPGMPMEALGNGLYKLSLPSGHTHVVFNAGGDNCQTSDLSAELGKAYNNSTNQWEVV